MLSMLKYLMLYTVGRDMKSRRVERKYPRVEKRNQDQEMLFILADATTE
jgi:hypothetical protein